MDPARAQIRTALDPTARPAPALAGRAAFEPFRRPPRRGRVRPAERDIHWRAATRTGLGHRRIVPEPTVTEPTVIDLVIGPRSAGLEANVA
ncbi:hypothetical protein ACPC54_05225 [Kitasatospora sp. NPDC094028]